MTISSITSYVWKRFLASAVWIMVKADIRKALTESIKDAEKELDENGKGLSGPAKFAKVKEVALTLIKGTATRYVDSLIHNLVVLVKG